MSSSVESVLSGQSPWHVGEADAAAFLEGLPADSVDLCLFSPPYEAARTYGIDFRMRGQDWVDWMVKVFHACLRVCRGLVACVCEGQTRSYRWSAVPCLLMADLHRAGVNLRRPVIFHRVGIPGSGGPDWLRADTEYIICATRPGKLPWSDNTACGHAPKWGPGGEMSYRQSDGTRRNQWGSNSCNERQRDGERNGNASVKKLQKLPIGRQEDFGMTGSVNSSDDGQVKKTGRRVVRGSKDGDTLTEDAYLPPVLANPGNNIEATYTAAQVQEMLQQEADWIHCNVGGGQMGSRLAHANEAPFSESLVKPFILSFCPPGGLVCDPFAGSGTTGAVAVRYGRRFLGCDVRKSQAELSTRRISEPWAETLSAAKDNGAPAADDESGRQLGLFSEG